jgi:hypothetical protein
MRDCFARCGASGLGSARLGSARLGSAREKFINYKNLESKSGTFGWEVGLMLKTDAHVYGGCKRALLNPHQSVAPPPVGTPRQVALPPTTPMQGSPTPATPWLGFAQKRVETRIEKLFRGTFVRLKFGRGKCEQEMPRYSGCAARERGA